MEAKVSKITSKQRHFRLNLHILVENVGKSPILVKWMKTGLKTGLFSSIYSRFLSGFLGGVQKLASGQGVRGTPRNSSRDNTSLDVFRHFSKKSVLKTCLKWHFFRVQNPPLADFPTVSRSRAHSFGEKVHNQKGPLGP